MALVEKADTIRRGAGGPGCDHWRVTPANPHSKVDPDDWARRLVEHPVHAGDHSYAASTGRYASRKAAAYAKQIGESKISRDQIALEKARVYAPINRNDGIDRKELSMFKSNSLSKPSWSGGLSRTRLSFVQEPTGFSGPLSRSSLS